MRQRKVPCSFHVQKKNDPLDEAQCYIHQNHLKMVQRQMPRQKNRGKLMRHTTGGSNFNPINSFDHSPGSPKSPFVRLIDDEQRLVKKLDLNIRRRDSTLSSPP